MDTRQHLVGVAGVVGRDLHLPYRTCLSVPYLHLVPFWGRTATGSVASLFQFSRVILAIGARAVYTLSSISLRGAPGGPGPTRADRQGHGGAGGSNGGATGFAEQIATIAAEKGYTEALDKTAIYLMQKCATILMLPFETFKPNGPSIGDYGLDSMIGMEMRTWLFKDLGLNIAFQELLAVTMNFNNLAALVLAERGINP
ncbi:hypothetical protein NUW58_g8450 [Xylaria curta]|uniref:Uncharacterized protein n=1 Tax=Xylaria curta TaxID=42375 RepID=A0ACC1N9E0_9PEZI|nr:hypothetical protein NUW58_g8450 [Xylaria curta]